MISALRTQHPGGSFCYRINDERNLNSKYLQLNTICMTLRQTPDDYLFHLEAVTSSDAKRLWRERIKQEWNHSCAYCGSMDNITLDHVKPRSLGGLDTTYNIVACCHECNQAKGKTDWEEWFMSQYFFDPDKYQNIKEYTEKGKPQLELYSYDRPASTVGIRRRM